MMALYFSFFAAFWSCQGATQSCWQGLATARLGRRVLWALGALGLAWVICAFCTREAQAAAPPPPEPTLSLSPTVADQHDDLGRPLRMAGVAAPQRIVSLLPSLTESICALGACERLVGVDRYSNWPPEFISRLPVMGGGIDPNIEAILAVKPDVVLLSRGVAMRPRLEALGLRTVVLDADSFADMQQMLLRLEQLLGLEDSHPAQDVLRRIEAAIQAEAASLPEAVRGQSVYFEASSGGYTAGTESFIGYLLARMGLENIVPSGLGAFPRLNPEFVLRASPDLLLMSASSDLPHLPGWKHLPAVQNQRWCRFTPEQIDVLVRPSPRMDEAAWVLGGCLRGLYPHLRSPTPIHIS